MSVVCGYTTIVEEKRTKLIFLKLHTSKYLNKLIIYQICFKTIRLDHGFTSLDLVTTLCF